MCTIFKMKITTYVVSIIVAVLLFLNFFNNNLLSIYALYGKYQCNNISSKLINIVVEEQLTQDIKDKIVVYKNTDYSTLDFNTSVLNSVSNNIIKNIQLYFYELEQGILSDDIFVRLGINVEKNKTKRGIVYEVPFSRAFNNIFISDLGFKIPVRYKLIGEITGQIVSDIKEYGINNALLEISLKVKSKVSVSLPLISEQDEFIVSVPLVVKLIQGKIPDSLLGTGVLMEGKR